MAPPKECNCQTQIDELRTQVDSDFNELNDKIFDLHETVLGLQILVQMLVSGSLPA